MSVVKPSFEKFSSTVVAVLDFSFKPRNFWTGLLVICFLASAIASLSLSDRRAVVLWFPDARTADGSRSRAELRYVSHDRESARMATSIVEELLLGPFLATSRAICVPDANLRSVIRSGKILYVDISSDILFGRSDSDGIHENPPVQPRVAVEYIQKTLGWNFPLLTIILMVDGLEPNWEATEIAKSIKFE